jgi:hypothetical protein
MDMRRFLSIERLIGKDIPKVALPQEYGPAPEYKTEERRSDNRNSGSKGGGAKHRKGPPPRK